MTRWLWIVLFAFAAQAIAQERNLNVQQRSASEGRRVALVIGNSSYKDAPLKNPANDATDMVAALQNLGFEVVSRTNANQRDMKGAVREFGQKLRGADAGLFFFAGHGLQVKGINYLVPVAVDIESEADAEDQAVSLDYVMRTMEESGAKFNIAVLDACRNNPFARSFRSASRGLAQTQTASGSFVAYATAPGSVAADGDGRNGLYTQHLLKNLAEGDSDILKVFQRVRTSVVGDSGGKQTPWESTSLVGDFYFRAAQPTQVASLTPVPLSLDQAPLAARLPTVGTLSQSGPKLEQTTEWIKEKIAQFGNVDRVNRWSEHGGSAQRWAQKSQIDFDGCMATFKDERTFTWTSLKGKETRAASPIVAPFSLSIPLGELAPEQISVFKRSSLSAHGQLMQFEPEEIVLKVPTASNRPAIRLVTVPDFYRSADDLIAKGGMWYGEDPRKELIIGLTDYNMANRLANAFKSAIEQCRQEQGAAGGKKDDLF